MPTGHYRFRRSLGNVSSRFRGARPDTYPLFTGILDTYPGAAAAYSLRALSSGWLAGDVVEVREDTGQTTQSFTAAQILNGDLVAFCGVGDGFVSTWYDQSGNGNDATQATTTAQPKIVDAGSLVTGGIDFDGVDDELNGASLSLSSLATSFSVTNAIAGITNSYVWSVNGTSGFVDYYTPTELPSIFASSVLSSATPVSGVAALKTSLFNGASSVIRVDGTQVASGDSGTNISTGALVIGGGNAAGDRMEGSIAELIIYPTNETSNFSSIETNINDEYSIY